MTLKLNMSKTSAASAIVRLHKVTCDWAKEHPTPANPVEAGRRATTNDATWKHTFFNVQTWTNLGGDFASSTSAATTISQLGPATWSGPGMLADVQAWRVNPGTNFGWELLGDETRARRRFGFDVRENPSPSLRPVLSVTYDLVPEPALLGLVAPVPLLTRRRRGIRAVQLTHTPGSMGLNISRNAACAASHSRWQSSRFSSVRIRFPLRSPILETQEIDKSLKIGYAVSLVDINGDGKPDIVVVDKDARDLVREPDLEDCARSSRGKKRSTTSASTAYDIDGDGKVDLALGAGWRPGNTGPNELTLQWYSRGKTLDEPLDDAPDQVRRADHAPHPLGRRRRQRQEGADDRPADGPRIDQAKNWTEAGVRWSCAASPRTRRKPIGRRR